MKNGLIKTYHNNGKLKTIENYVDDKLDGVYEYYNYNGELLIKCYHKNDRLKGIRKLYYNGQIENISYFINNREIYLTCKLIFNQKITLNI